MNNLDNLHSYDNVEYVQAHELSNMKLLEYCNHKMQSAKSDAEFIEEKVFIGGGYDCPIDVCEIGGGNGKLLYSLEKKGILKRGINYEISNSRCILAKKFSELLSCSRVTNKNQNFLDDKMQKNKFDCIVMVDIVMQLITPLYDLAENDMIEWIRQALKKGGYLFLEIADYSSLLDQIMKEGIVRQWEEFPEADPFQYSLQKLTVDSDNNIVNEKFFIGRDSNTRDYFKNVIRSYSQKDIIDIFKNGFDVSVYPYENNLLLCNDKTESNRFRILARKTI